MEENAELVDIDGMWIAYYDKHSFTCCVKSTIIIKTSNKCFPQLLMFRSNKLTTDGNKCLFLSLALN